MSKPQIAMHEPLGRISQRVIYGDTDAGGVVYHANYLRYFERGRTELMRERVMPYSAIEQNGLILPLTESYLRFKAPARYDDLIAIETCVAEVSRFTGRFHYRILRVEEDRQQFLVKGFTVHACIDRQGRLTPFPDDLLEKMEKLAGRP